MLGFLVVLANCARLLGSSCVGLVLAAACSVFPDQALLPRAMAVAGAAGELSPPSDGEAGAAGTAGATPNGGMPAGGAPVVGVGEGGFGGAVEVSSSDAGAGGVGGAGGEAPDCLQSGQDSIDVAVDLWVDSADKKANHGKDALLYVVRGAEERRAMFQLGLPQLQAGTRLLRATFSVSLASNADVDKAERRLGLHRLSQNLAEDKTTWSNYAQGNKAWNAGGGDFGARWATLTLPAGTERATLTFDVTSNIQNLLSTAPLQLAMVILEIDAAPSATAQLAITSMEGNASQKATLTLTYCEP